MPIYEFECRECGRKTTALVLSRERINEVRCRRCGSADLVKLFSRFATPKSEEARLEAMADRSALGDVDENDPRSVARWMKRMGAAMGEDFGDEMEQAVEEEAQRGDKDAGAGQPGGAADDDGS